MQCARIDVHQHVLPPAYVAWLRARGVDEAGGRALPAWSADEALGLMDRYDVATAILSVSAPGVYLPTRGEEADAVRARAREVNEATARVVQGHPGRFGFFATVPLPDLDGALVETAYALDVLGAVGVILLANVGGEYVGASEHDVLFAELERRRAVAFVHPAELPGPRLEWMPPFAADFLLDTTRAAYRLVQSGIVRRRQGVKIILAHAGGFVPYASHRLAAALSAETQRSPLELLDELASFYFDTALSGSPAALPSLLAFAKPGHVLFGSDWPFAPEIAVQWFTAQLDAYDGLDAAGHVGVDRTNAEALFPRFATHKEVP